MTAWPQIARCMQRQWDGYGDVIRTWMCQEWQNGAIGCPGNISGLGHQLHVIWTVERKPGESWRPGDHLMSVKIDNYPAP